jgi:tyrosine-protein kinase Etk/Wzc
MKNQNLKPDVPLEVVEAATHELRLPQPALGSSMEEQEPTLREYIETILDARWLILATMVSVLIGGALYLLLATPIYQADALVQVEEKKTTLAGMDNLSDMFSSTSPAETEIEILRSRMLVGSVVDELRLDVVTQPRFFPVFGRGIARRYASDVPVTPVLGLASFAWGGERIGLSHLEVPKRWEGKPLTVVARGGSRYDLLDPEGNLVAHGEAGKALALGRVGLFVSDLLAREGTHFRIARLPRAKVIEKLQKDLVISEKGKKTGVIRIVLDGADPEHTSAIVDAIARTYLRQNVERKSAEAEKTLQFISGQLPQLKVNVNKAEAALNAYRQERGGGFDLSVETKAALDRAADIEKLLTEIELQRNELRERFTESHPAFVALNRKVAQLQGERGDLDRQLKGLPETELNAARLTRDAKVASELYVLLMNKAQELQVIKSGTIGNVRILDGALVPEEPVSPRTGLTLALSLLLGVALGIAIAFTRKALHQGVEDPDVIERETGLPVYASVPHSPSQAALAQALRKRGSAAVPVLAASEHDDLAVEALRSLRTSLQFALADASNNIIAIAGPSPGIGKSFLSVNLAHVLADVGRRVLLVDADLRRGHLHRYFGVAKAPGLPDLICGTATEEEAIRKTSADNLHFLAMGDRPPNPSELLSSSRFEDLMVRTSRAYDLILIDTAPVLAVTDATLACRPAGTTLLVLRAGQHPVREIAAATRRLLQSGVTPRAIILNDVLPRAAGYAYSKYGYSYHYDYR